MASPSEPPASITLRVKVPPGTLPCTLDGSACPDEFLLGAVSITANIGSIRQRIQQLLPSHPAPESQRLLYGGRALVNDEQSVADALNTRRDPTQTDYVVHMVIRGEGANGGPAGTTTARLAHSRGATPNATAQQPQQPAAMQNNLPGQQIPLQAQQQAQQQQHPQLLPHIVRSQVRMQVAATGPGIVPAYYPQGQPVQQIHQLGGMQLPPGTQIPRQFNANAAGGLSPPPQYAQQLAQGSVPGQLYNQNAGGGMYPSLWHEMMAHQQQQQPQFYQQQQQQQQQPGASSAMQNMAGQYRPMQGQQTAQTAGAGNGIAESSSNNVSSEESRQTAFEGSTVPPATSGETGQSQVHQQWCPTANPSAAAPVESGLAAAAQRALASHHATQHRLHQRLASAERSRRDLAEMRQNLQDLQNLPNLTPEHTRRIQESQEQVDRLQNSIGPQMGNTRRPRMRRVEPLPMSMLDGHGLSDTPDSQSYAQSTGARSRVNQNVSCYLLNSLEGPRALLFSPQFGTYAGFLPHTSPETFNSQMAALRPTPTTAAGQTTNNAAAAHQRDENIEEAVQREVQAAVAERAQAQAQLQAQEPLGPLQPLLGHVWLLMRILIFAYFLLGSNMGWQRPLILLAIGLGFWILRMGFLGEGAPLRRWWDGLVQVPQRDRAAGQGPEQDQQQPNAADQRGRQNDRAPVDPGRADRANHNNQPPAPARRPQIMPTPEQVAQRLLDEDAARRRGRGNWLREQLRPVERGVALFVASLWPGVGEAHVRAQEREQRRVQEEEVVERETREREEAARAAEEKEKERSDGDGGDAGKVGESSVLESASRASGEGSAEASAACIGEAATDT